MALGGLGLVLFLFPRGGSWVALALVLGGLYAAENEAAKAGIGGPLADLGVTARKV